MVRVGEHGGGLGVRDGVDAAELAVDPAGMSDSLSARHSRAEAITATTATTTLRLPLRRKHGRCNTTTATARQRAI